MPIRIDAAVLREGLLGAHELGRAVVEQTADAAYRRLHGGRTPPPPAAGAVATSGRRW